MLLLISCYSRIDISEFDRAKWDVRRESCETGLEQADILIANSERLLTSGEVQIKALLGEPDKHELYTRNEKFFYYHLTGDSCGVGKKLSIRFNALDRAKEVMIAVAQ